MCPRRRPSSTRNCLFIWASGCKWIYGFIAAVLTAISRPISRSERDHSIREAAAGEITSERLFFVFRPPKRPRWHKQMTSNLFRPKLSSATCKRTYFTIKRWNLERRELNARSRRQQFTVARLGGGYRVTVRSHCAVNHVLTSTEHNSECINIFSFVPTRRVFRTALIATMERYEVNCEQWSV